VSEGDTLTISKLFIWKKKFFIKEKGRKKEKENENEKL
jgi:hypothetical protein